MFIARIAPQKQNEPEQQGVTGGLTGGLASEDEAMNPYSIENHEQGQSQVAFDKQVRLTDFLID